MELSIVGQAVPVFALTDIDDLFVLTLFFGRVAGRRSGIWRVFAGQYLGIAVLMAASVFGVWGADLLPASAIRYLGLLPLALGIRAAWEEWGPGGDDADELVPAKSQSLSVLAVAAVTFANGGDNIGVYVPVFATTNVAGVVTYCAAFLVMVGVWCALALYLATRPAIAAALSRWGNALLPIVLIALGAVILVNG